MQIFVNAIEKSRTDDTQYVLFKSLDMECVSDKRALLELLQDGWQIMGKYHNGVGYEKYKLTSPFETTSVNHYIHETIFVKSFCKTFPAYKGEYICALDKRRTKW